MFPVHFKICWMLFPPRKLLGKIVGLISNGFKGKKYENDLFRVRDAQNKRVVKICGLQADDILAKDPGEALQTTTVPLIEPVDLSVLSQEAVEFVPGKLVTVRKAGPNGGKKKCRAVVCGNLLQSDLDPAPGNLYASVAHGILIRAALAHSVQKGWGAGVTDIPLCSLAETSGCPGGDCCAPKSLKVFVEAKVCNSSERWRVHNALYGFTSSPARWAVHRDQTMGGFTWKMDGCDFSLKRTEEGNLWKL